MMSSSQRNKPSGSSSSSSSSSISSKFRSISPSGKFSSSHTRSTSPTRITVRNLNHQPSSPSVRFSMTSPHRSMTSSTQSSWSHGSKKTCLCSPTTHPGSFRCSLHKNSNFTNTNTNTNTVSYMSHRLYARRSAMTNSLVRIGTVEGGDLVKRALAALIRPSSHQIRRRSDFRPRPSRLSVMSKAGE